MRTRLALCLILVLWSIPGAGREIFVDNRAGDDRSTGGQLGIATARTGPVRTLARALRLADAGDVIVLAKTGVPYHESISLVGSRYSGTQQQPFTIRGSGAVLDGSMPIPPEAWKPYEGAVFRFRPRLTAYQQLFLDGVPAVRVIAAGASHRPPKLEPRQWCLLDGQIYFCVDRTKLPRDYKLSCAGQQTGITLYHVEHVLVADLVVQGFQLDGVNLFNSSRYVTLAGVTCRGNGRSGVTAGGASLAEIDGSLLGDNGWAQLLTLPCSETYLRGTRLLSNTAPGWVDQGGRVFLDGRPLKGGLDEFHGEPKP